MPLQVLPAVASDALSAVTIEAAAYANNRFNSTLFPGPFAPDTATRRAEGFVATLEKPQTRWWKVVDTDIAPDADAQSASADGVMIAFAEWYINDPVPPPPPPRQYPPGSNVEACDALFGGIVRGRQQMLGDEPHIYLRYLHTDPKHQRRGAGRMLMDKLTEECKRTGLPGWLESSDAGHKLYQSSGFCDVGTIEEDMTRFGGPGVHFVYCMRYDPPK